MADIIVCIFLFILLIGSICDVKSFEIPNWVSVLATCLFIPASLWLQFPATQIILHIGTGITVLIVGFVIYAAGWMGGGDVKMIAASSIWFGFSELPTFLFLVALVGGVLAILLFVFRKMRLAGVWARVSWIQNLHREEGIPYGVAISTGAILAYPQLVPL